MQILQAWPTGLQRALARGGEASNPKVKVAFEAVGGVRFDIYVLQFRSILEKIKSTIVPLCFVDVPQALHYLGRCLIDVQLVQQRKLFWYDIEMGTDDASVNERNQIRTSSVRLMEKCRLIRFFSEHFLTLVTTFFTGLIRS